VHGLQLCRRTSPTHSALPMPYPAKLELLHLVLPINQCTTSGEAQPLSRLTTRPCFSFHHGIIWQMSTGRSSRKQSNSTMHRQPAVELYVQTGSTQKLMLMGKGPGSWFILQQRRELAPYHLPYHPIILLEKSYFFILVTPYYLLASVILMPHRTNTSYWSDQVNTAFFGKRTQQ
jgi:hypothetical protein